VQRGSGSQAYKFPREAVNFEFPYYHPSRRFFGVVAFAENRTAASREEDGRLLIALVDRERECGRSGYDGCIIGACNGDRIRPGRCPAAPTTSTTSPASR
jgi:hypothetical protein